MDIDLFFKKLNCLSVWISCISFDNTLFRVSGQLLLHEEIYTRILNFHGLILFFHPPFFSTSNSLQKKKKPYQASKDMEILNAYFFKPGFLGQFIFFQCLMQKRAPFCIPVGNVDRVKSV